MKHTFQEFSEDECMNMAAALAYYTVFSLPPLLLLVITIAGLVVNPVQVQQMIQSQVGGMIGPQAAGEINTMVSAANEQVRAHGGAIGLIIGIGALLFGATGAFAQLQYALNKAWEVQPDPEASSWKDFIVKRFFSLGMILAVAFLLLVSLTISAVLSALGEQIGRMMPGGFSDVLLQAINFAISFGVITVMFAAIFKVLPDAIIRWRDVWVAAVVTALLFTIGKFAIGLYLGQSNPGSAFGAAGSLVLILVWIYYSSLIVLFGAEFAQVWAQRKGTEIMPEKGAVRVIKETRRIRPDREGSDRPAARREPGEDASRERRSIS